MLERVRAHGLRSRLTLSHAFALGGPPSPEVAAVLDELAAWDVALRLVRTTARVFAAVTATGWRSRHVRQIVVRALAPVALRLVPRLPGASRGFEYVAQLRAHHRMSDGARAAARGRRGRVVGRRLPWTGEDHAALRSASWQVHAHGPADDAARALGERLRLETHVVPPDPEGRLQEGLLYLVRPDGSVAAAALPADAAQRFPEVMPDRWSASTGRESAGPRAG